MADLYFSESAYGTMGYTPDVPITIDMGLGIGCDMEVAGYAVVEVSFGLLIQAEMEFISHNNDISFGLGIGLEAEFVGTGQVAADFGLGLGLDMTYTAPLPVDISFGLGLGLVGNMIQHGLSMDVGLGVGCGMDMVQPGIGSIDFCLGIGFETSFQSPRTCALSTHSSSKWV